MPEPASKQARPITRPSAIDVPRDAGAFTVSLDTKADLAKYHRDGLTTRFMNAFMVQLVGAAVGATVAFEVSLNHTDWTAAGVSGAVDAAGSLFLQLENVVPGASVRLAFSANDVDNTKLHVVAASTVRYSW